MSTAQTHISENEENFTIKRISILVMCLYSGLFSRLISKYTFVPNREWKERKETNYDKNADGEFNARPILTETQKIIKIVSVVSV